MHVFFQLPPAAKTYHSKDRIDDLQRALRDLKSPLSWLREKDTLVTSSRNGSQLTLHPFEGLFEIKSPDDNTPPPWLSFYPCIRLYADNTRIHTCNADAAKNYFLRLGFLNTDDHPYKTTRPDVHPVNVFRTETHLHMYVDVYGTLSCKGLRKIYDTKKELLAEIDRVVTKHATDAYWQNKPRKKEINLSRPAPAPRKRK